MTAFQRQWRLDLGLRTAGVLLCGLAWLAIAHLAALPLRPRSVDMVAYGLATIGFLSGSAGSAMAILGRHLCDEIEVSQRWRHRLPARRAGAAKPGAALDAPETRPSFLARNVVGGRS